MQKGLQLAVQKLDFVMKSTELFNDMRKIPEESDSQVSHRLDWH